MIFSSNKDGSPKEAATKGGEELTINSDTFRRWKEASMKNNAPVNEVPIAPQAPSPAPITPRSTTSTKTADWPEDEAPIRIIDDAVAGMDFGSPAPTQAPTAKASGSFGSAYEPENRFAGIGSKATAAKSAGSKFAQFVSGLGGSKQAAPEPPQVARTFSSPVPGSSVQSQTLNNLSVDDRKQLFKEEEQLRSSEDDIRHRFGANLKSALSAGTIIEGKFKFDSPVRIDGTLMGEVQASSLLIVGGEASVEAKIKVGSLVVLGVVKGNIEADELVEIKRGGLLEGDVKCARFAIEEGGWFQGKVTPTTEPKARTLAKKVEKVVEPTTTASSNNGNGFHPETTQSEQLSLGGTSNLTSHPGAKVSWSN